MINSGVKVTIITPTYNRSDLIEETIISVLNQSYKNLEYIVIDDGSTDNTRDIVHKYKDKLKYIYKENKGQAAALNYGFEIAKGEYIGYLSSDDLLHVDAIKELVQALDESKEFVLTYCDWSLINQNSKFIRKMTGIDYSEKYLYENLECAVGPGSLFRKEVLEKIGGWDTNLRQIPDFEFFLRLAKLGNFKRVPQNLSNFRIHDYSLSSYSDPESADEIINIDKDNFPPHISKRKSNSFGFLISYKYHMQSGRIFTAFNRVFKSLKEHPKIIFNTKFYRMLVSGILKNFAYGLKRPS